MKYEIKTPIYLHDRPQEVKIAISSHKLAKKILKYQDRVSLYKGIQKTWAYAKQVGHQKAKLTPIELESPLLPRNWKIK